MKNIQIEKNPSLPEKIYIKILELIKDEIFEIGERLPSEKQLAKDLKVSRTVLREALYQLEIDGYIVRKHGVGTFITSNTPKFSSGLEKLDSMTELIKTQGLEPGTINMKVKEDRASDLVAGHLQIKEEEKVSIIERVRTADNQPFAFDILVFSPKAIDVLFQTNNLPESIFNYLESEKNISLAHSLCNIFPENASADLAQKLNVEFGEALQVLEQVYYTQENTPVFYGKSFIRNDVLKFHLTRRR